MLNSKEPVTIAKFLIETDYFVMVIASLSIQQTLISKLNVSLFTL